MRTGTGALVLSILTTTFSPAICAIEVSDNGPGFDYMEADVEEGGELTEGGLGLAIIRSLADEFELGSRNGGLASPVRQELPLAPRFPPSHRARLRQWKPDEN